MKRYTYIFRDVRGTETICRTDDGLTPYNILPGWVTIDNPDGSRLMINMRLVIYVEEKVIEK